MHTIHLTPEIEAVLARQPDILINISGGKDSEAMLHQLVGRFGRTHQIRLIWADTGWEYKDNPGEWLSALHWCEARAAYYGYPLNVVRNETHTLPARIRARKMFPSAKARFCTSDYKRKPILKFINNHIRNPYLINAVGIRAAESPKRAKYLPWEYDAEASAPTRAKLTQQPRLVYQWYPLFDWSTPAVFAYAAAHGLPLHPAYKFLTRFSCQVCIFNTAKDLSAIRIHNRQAFDEIALLEQEIGFTMHHGQSIVQMADAYDTGSMADADAPQQMCMW